MRAIWILSVGAGLWSERHACVNPQDAFNLNCNRKAACVILQIGCSSRRLSLVETQMVRRLLRGFGVRRERLGAGARDGVRDAADGVFAGRGQQPCAGLGEGGDHLPAFLRLVQQRAQRGDQVGGGEAPVQQLGDDAPPGNQVDHRDRQIAVSVRLGGNLCGVANHPPGQRKGERRNAVDHDKWRADGQCLHGRRATGDDRGARVEQGPRVVDQYDPRQYCKAGQPLIHGRFVCGNLIFDPRKVDGRCHRQQKLATALLLQIRSRFRLAAACSICGRF